MTDQLKYRAKIKARGLDTTGVTEDHARRMAATLGKHSMFVVEGIHDTVVTDAEGNQQVTIRLTSVEPVPAAHEDTVREFQAALYRSRPDREGQATLQGTASGQTVEDAATALSAAVERDDEGTPTGTWDGDPDAPLPAGLSAVPSPPPEGYCDFPGCDLGRGHDGDHAEVEDDEGDEA